VVRGWARPALTGSYERERRPVGLHNVARSADAGGARRVTDDSLPWDLNGRLTHAWLVRDGARVSTIDVIGDGLTLLRPTTPLGVPPLLAPASTSQWMSSS
jgi:putative polyketide hydroxylase